MAGDWIKVQVTTPDKPEVFRIAEILDMDPDAVFGKLFRVWCWFDEHTETGNAPSVTKNIIDRITSVQGFANAMIDAGWMIVESDFIQLPNFDRHNGETAKKRALTAKRVKAHKDKNQPIGNEKVTPNALPREEKNREEYKKNGSGDSTTNPHNECTEKNKKHTDHRAALRKAMGIN